MWRLKKGKNHEKWLSHSDGPYNHDSARCYCAFNATCKFIPNLAGSGTGTLSEKRLKSLIFNIFFLRYTESIDINAKKLN